MSPFLASRHDAIVGCYAVVVMAGLKGFTHDDVAVVMECEHGVVVARAGSDGELAHVISIKFTDRLDDHVELI